MTDARARRPWLAALLSALCQGLGHLYAGRPLAAIAVHAVSIAIAVAAAFALRQGLGLIVAATIGSSAFWVAQAILAARAARRAAPGPRRWFSHPLALVVVLVAGVLESSALGSFLKANVARTAYMPSASMTPTLRPGDYVVIAAGRPSDLGGAIILFAAPPSSRRRDDLVKRVVAVEGDTVELRDGHLVVNGVPVPHAPIPGPCTYETKSEGGPWAEEPCVSFVETLGPRTYHTYCTPYLPCGDVEPQRVPPGHVWVAGDHRDHSADSRVFGPVPVASIRGEVRYVAASWGSAGFRRERFGLALR